MLIFFYFAIKLFHHLERMKMKNKQLFTLLSLTMFSTLNFAQGIVTPQLVTVDQYRNNNSRSVTGSNTSTTSTSS